MFKNAAFIVKARVGIMRDMGGCLSPFNAFLIAQGLETLHIRMKEHSENALKVAKFLEKHNKVKRVLYPALENHEDYALAQKYMPKGISSMLGFEIVGGKELSFGSFGIKTLDAKWIDSRQIEAARVAINRYMNREGQVWIRIFPDKPITRKPADVRMGKGKGDVAGWVAPVTPGRILFEVEGVSFNIAKEALRLGAQKLPVKTKFVVRRDYDKNA